MFRNNYPQSGQAPTPPRVPLPPLGIPTPTPGSSLEERLSSCERGLQFLMEESVRSRGQIRLQLNQIGQGGGAAAQEASLLRSQLASTQSQMAGFMRQSTRQAFLEVERERLLTSQEEFSNQTRLDVNIGRVAGEMRDLSQRVSQSTQLSERQLDGLSRDVESGTVTVKRLATNLSFLNSSLHKSDERLSSHLSMLETACAQDHQAMRTSLSNRAEKCRADLRSLEESWAGESSEVRSSLGRLESDVRELVETTNRRVKQISESEGKERETLERMLLKELYNTRDRFEVKLEAVQARVGAVEIDLKQRCKKQGRLLTHLQSSLNILERELEAERTRTNHLLQAEIGARKQAVSGLQSGAEKMRSDFLTLLNSAHQGNHLTEIKLQQLQGKLEQSLAGLTSELQEYRSDCQESAGHVASLRESVAKELTSLEAVQKLREESSASKRDLEARLSSLTQRVESLQTVEDGMRTEVAHLSSRLGQMKEEQTRVSESLTSELSKSQRELIELNSELQPLLATPQALTALSRQSQQLETWLRQHGDETIQLNRTLQALQHMFSQKLHLEETARVSALTGIRNELHVIQSRFPHLSSLPPYPPHEQPPHPKPSTLHIPQQPSLNLTLPSSYDQLTSITLPVSTCTSAFNPFSALSLPTQNKQPFSTPKGNPTSLSDPQYTTSPIEGEVRVVSSIRSQYTQEQKDSAKEGVGAGSAETSNEESPASITDKFQAVSDEHPFTPLIAEPIRSISSSPGPGEGRRDATQSVQDRVLSMIREESESLLPSETNLHSALSADKSLPTSLQQESKVASENAGSVNQESEQLSPLPLSPFNSSTSGTAMSRQYSLPDSLGREKPTREYRRLRTVESVARQSFVKSPDFARSPVTEDIILEVGEEQALNEWGLYQAVFWLKIKSSFMRPVLRMREKQTNDSQTI